MSCAANGALRVALMLESDGPGGAETMLLHLAEELRRRGHTIIPVGPDNRTGWLAARFRDRGFDPLTYTLRRPVDWECVRGLTRLLRSNGADVVHSHEFTMAIYGSAAAGRISVPHVITMHGGRYFAGLRRRRIAMRWALRRSAATVAVSRATANDLARSLGVPAERVHVVPNGLAFRAGSGERIRRELGVSPDELLAVSVGNLYAVKGHATLVKALAAQGDAVPRYRVAIAGRGEEEGPLRALARAGGVADRLHILGFRDDVPDLLAAADVFVLPSRSEGLPLALVEAMTAGRAIIASDVGGVPEVVAPGDEALLVPPGDPAALALALRYLADEPGVRQQLGIRARTRALREFSVVQMANAYERVYRAALAERR